VDQQVGIGDAPGKCAGQVAALAVGAAIGVRRGREIGRADVVAGGFVAEQIADAGTIGTGRGAENPGQRVPAMAVRRAAHRSQRIFVVRFIPRCDGFHRSIEQCDLRREEIAEQAGNAPGHVDAGTAEHGAG